MIFFSSASRMRSHGFGDRVGVGTDIIKISRGAAGWGSALANQATVTVSFRLPEKLCSTNWRRNQIDQVQQSVILAQSFLVCGNLFLKFFCARDSNRAEKFLSSSRVVNATRVVQGKRFSGYDCVQQCFALRSFPGLKFFRLSEFYSCAMTIFNLAASWLLQSRGE